MNEQIEKALAFDPIATAEKLTGLDSHNDDGVVWLGMALALKHGEVKSKLLRESRDTCMNNNLGQQLEAIEGIGFKLLHCADIPGTEDKWRMFWRNGVLLFCDSYSGEKSLNSGHAYFNYCGPRDVLKCSNGPAGEIDGQIVWSGGIDVREGLKHRLDAMTESGKILSDWVKAPFLWLLHYKDTKQSSYDYKSINEERIALLPEEVQRAIRGKVNA